ncbi:MAG: tannase/feruloyl esterase family alpha/beta hydrolase [Pseudomonadota bacterium]
MYLQKSMTGSRFGSARKLSHLLPIGAAVAVACVVAGCGGSDDPVTPAPPAASAPTPQQLAASCTSLKGTKVGDVTVTATKRTEAVNDNPAFCQVLGTRAPYLDIEVDVPDNWSGRLWQQGGGGFDGRIPSAVATDAATGATTLDISLKTGRSVYAASNGGNRANVPAEAGPLVWTNGTQEGVASAQDYAYAALNTTREFAKAVTKTFYGKLPDRVYFSGCSNGGRNAYIAAERWPQEYDGIVAGCETMDMASQTAAWMNMGSRVGTPAGLSVPQWGAVSAAGVAACDALDGVKDGVIANNAACKFDVAVLQCGQPTASADAAICLTADQVQTVRSLTSDIKLANGTSIYAGYTWSSTLQSVPSFGTLGGGFALLATGDPAWFTQPAKQQSFNLERDFPIFRFGLRQAGADHDKNKVAAYVASGKKLISWHAGSDNLLSLNDHVRNYSTMTGIAKTLGTADPSTGTRFFVVPGATHGQGAALTEVNWFDAITNWVEKNTAPAQLTYNQRATPTGAARTLPVCQHPQYPRYNGTGDVNSAGSYTCTAP